MKHIALLICCLIIICLLMGCNGSESHSINDGYIHHGLIAGSKTEDEFPDFLVGTWAGNEKDWRIVFEPNGTISEIKHPLISIPIIVEQGGVYEQLRGGAFAVYFLGPCNAKYNPNERILSVTINIDDFFMKLPIGDQYGKITDHITGRVSDNNIRWLTEWTTSINIPTINPTGQDNVSTQSITFQKID